MKTPTDSRSAVVADDRVLMRDLLRFALDELGFVMASEVSTGAAAIDAAAEHRPQVMILHEGTVPDPEVIEQIRSVSPDSTVVVLTTDRAATSTALAAAADAVVEEGTGLQDLPSAIGPSASANRRPRPRTGGRARGERWLKRVQGAVAAAILLVGVMVVLPASGFDGSLAAAHDSLVLLADELPDATPEEAVSLATTLVSQRAMLLSGDVDVTALDAEIAERLRPLLPMLPPDVARGLTGVLGELVTDEAPAAQTPASSPSADATAPGPYETSSPPPEATATATPDDTVSPDPSESPSPDPSESPSPDPSESPSPIESPSSGGDLASPSAGEPS
jgi:CheY-like chemotaxis protein